MRLQRYLTEKTFNINADVDLVYNKIFKHIHKYWLKGDYHKFDMLVRGRTNSKSDSISSGELKSKQAKEAHAVNPIDIYLTVDDKGNYYSPAENVIHFSFNAQQVDILRSANFDMDRVEGMVGTKMKRFVEELSVSAIKGSIYHELSHWLNDSLHDKNITKLLNRAAEHVGHEWDVMKQGHGNVNQTFIEIDAQIHSIKQIKRDNKKTWNDITWTDIVQLKSPFLGVIRKSILNNEYDEYMKHMLKRMHREGLLTRKLQKIPTSKDMWRLLDKL